MRISREVQIKTVIKTPDVPKYEMSNVWVEANP